MIRKSILWISLTLLTGITLFPLYFMVASSFLKGCGVEEIFNPVIFWQHFTLGNYQDLWNSGPFSRYFLNSLIVAILVTLGNIFFASMVAYALAWHTFPYRNSLMVLIFCSMMLPPQTLMFPTYKLMTFLGAMDTYLALIVPQIILPMNIFMMKQYFEKIPKEIALAAQLDGASSFRIFFSILLPLSKPMLAVLSVNTFMNSWNSFLYPFLFTRTQEMRTLPVGLAHYRGLYEVDTMQLMAGATFASLPVILLFLFCQRWILEGMLKGSVRG
ncbi:MAG: carbohydrate ABC transporter permease [Planctomycetota bacterium]